MGDFQDDTVPPAAARALDELTTWLADLHGIDPMGHGVATSTGGPSTRYAEGTEVDLPNVMGHRDTGLATACPGDHLYDIVRGSRPLGPRIEHRLEVDYGWAPRDVRLAAPQPAVPPAAPTDTPADAATDAATDAASDVETAAAATERAALGVATSVVDGFRTRDVGVLVSQMLSVRLGASLGR